MGRIKHFCGIFGVFNNPNSAEIVYHGLISLQHRGQEAAGIVSKDTHWLIHRAMGMVSGVFNKENLSTLTGNVAIGHVRYSTSGSSDVNNVQPILSQTQHGTFALAHNGNIPNIKGIRDELLKQGVTFQTTMDSEVIVQLLARAKELSNECLQEIFENLEAAFSLLIMTNDEMIGVRDKFGFRPLCLGKLGDSWILSSESCGLDAVGAEFLREIEPGEIVRINKDFDGSNPHYFYQKQTVEEKFCPFEIAYFSRPDSRHENESIAFLRDEIGKQLFAEFPVRNGIVVPVPDSGIDAAHGYAEASGLQLKSALRRNHQQQNLKRSFLQPTDDSRKKVASQKFLFIREFIKGKDIILVDDSVVRGHTSRNLIKQLRDLGAKSVILLSSFPKVIHPCYYGVDFPTKEELIAVGKTDEEIALEIGADAVHFISPQGLFNALGSEKFCTACFTGNYPTKIEENLGKYSLE